MSAFQVKASVVERKPTSVLDVHWQVQLHLSPARGIWLMKRPNAGIWGGLWSPPILELDTIPERQPDHVHRLTHRRLNLYGKASGTTPSGEGQWVTDITKFALPTGIHRLLLKQGVKT